MCHVARPNFGQGQDFELTTELSEKVQPSNQKQLKWNNTAYVNNWSFTFKIELCVFPVTKAKLCMKVIRIFNAQPVKIPHFKSLLTCKQALWPNFFYCIFLMF